MNKPLKVLVVDDEDSVRLNFRMYFEDSGFLVFEGANGQEGLTTFLQERPDLVLTDLRMPGMDGLALIATLKEQSPETPVIVVSGTGALQDAIESVRCGAWDYLVKPVMEADEIELTVNRVLERARLLAENHRYREQLEELVHERTDQLLQSEERYRTLNAELEQRIAERTKELELANRHLETFAYTVSHDLCAPLRAISGLSQVLLEDFAAPLGQTGQRCLERIIAGCQRMDSLIMALLDFSRLTRQPMKKELVETSDLVREVIAELVNVEKERAVELTVGTLPNCLADPTLLRQVYINLLGNAFKYTGGCDPAEIEVGSFCQDGADVFYVKDNGAGFDMQYAAKLFEVFQRLHTDNEFKGNGIGLALVRNIVQRHGGRIWGEGEVNRGATFYFTLSQTTADTRSFPIRYP